VEIGKEINPKSEYRNPKQIQIAKTPIFKTRRGRRTGEQMINAGLVFSVSSVGTFGAMVFDKFITDKRSDEGDEAAEEETAEP